MQYEESKDFLLQLILGKPLRRAAPFPSNACMPLTSASSSICKSTWTGLGVLAEYAYYFLTKIDLVVIRSENLSSALKIFETINQRGAGLTRWIWSKNLLSKRPKATISTVSRASGRNSRATWSAPAKGRSPLRFRYFLMARYYDGILREDEIYKWIISAEGKQRLRYEQAPHMGVELEKGARRYADLVRATELLMNDGGDYPSVTRIGFMNKVKSRQHLILLLALRLHNNTAEAINYTCPAD